MVFASGSGEVFSLFPRQLTHLPPAQLLQRPQRHPDPQPGQDKGVIAFAQRRLVLP